MTEEIHQPVWEGHQKTPDFGREGWTGQEGEPSDGGKRELSSIGDSFNCSKTVLIQQNHFWSSSIKTVFSIGYRLKAADTADIFIKLS
ncbi:hypothetical protein ACF8EA_15610 [Pseudomonas sp. YQ_5]|uniref:hypothetical protein n=1 Tax=Pseudomonas sp. YQ_5 TaxID=3367229 RepID=UPI00370BF112